MNLKDKYICQALHEITLSMGDLGINFAYDGEEDYAKNCLNFLLTEVVKNKAEIIKLKEGKKKRKR